MLEKAITYALFSIFKSIYFVFSLAYGNLHIYYLALFHHDHLICNLILPKKSFVFLNGERIAYSSRQVQLSYLTSSPAHQHSKSSPLITWQQVSCKCKHGS